MASRTCGKSVFVLLVLLLSSFELISQTTNFSITPVPSWVRLAEWSFPTTRLTPATSEGSRYLLYERQEHPEQKESFTRVVRLMENQTGVQDSGSLRFSFEPSFQELHVNSVQIHRNGRILEKLDRSKIKLIQP